MQAKKKKLYELIVGQLKDDGFLGIVEQLEKEALVLAPDDLEKDSLLRVVCGGGMF
jgi:hypothetical protein